ncbi:hypothetical protein GW17_00052200 [Ensete ventricosum]|nr:hypothetical protein GW17_00052200 [Ensete ventricosum]
MRQRLIPAQGRSHRLVQHEEGGIASSLRWETPVPMVPPDSGRSAYQYPVGPIHTTHTRRNKGRLGWLYSRPKQGKTLADLPSKEGGGY